MNYSQKLLTWLKAANDGASDYRAAKIIGVTPQAVSHVRAQNRQFSDKTAVRIAQELKLDPIKVIARLHIDSESCHQTRQVWEEIIKLTEIKKQ